MPIIGWFTRNSILCLHSKLCPFVMKLLMLHIIYEFQLSFAYLITSSKESVYILFKGWYGSMQFSLYLCIFISLFIKCQLFSYVFSNPFSNFTTDFNRWLLQLRALKKISHRVAYFYISYWYRKTCLIVPYRLDTCFRSVCFLMPLIYLLWFLLTLS
jgi:hypothetical protein